MFVTMENMRVLLIIDYYLSDIEINRSRRDKKSRLSITIVPLYRVNHTRSTFLNARKFSVII
jgi:hypothetical protein